MKAYIGFLKHHYHTGYFITSGSKVPPIGGMIIAVAELNQIGEMDDGRSILKIEIKRNQHNRISDFPGRSAIPKISRLPESEKI